MRRVRWQTSMTPVGQWHVREPERVQSQARSRYGNCCCDETERRPGRTQWRTFRAVASVGEDGQRTTESQHAGEPPDGIGVAAWGLCVIFLSCDLKHAGSSVSLFKCNLPSSTTAVIFSIEWLEWLSSPRPTA